MNVKEAIETRRAVKHFDPTHIMSDEEFQQLMSLAILSPTAFNIQHWRFVRVTDQNLREELRSVTYMQRQITDASLLLILCADTNAWEKNPERYWGNADADTRAGILEAIKTYYTNNKTLQRDEAIRSCGIAAQTLMLAAKSMGYDSCPMDLSDLNAVGKLINLPEDHIVVMFVAIGKALQGPWPRGGQLSMEEVLITNHF